MRILFVADPLASFKIYKDTTYAMMAEAAGRGHSLHACLQEDLLLDEGEVRAHASGVILTGAQYGDARPWFTLAEPVREKLSAYDAVLMRKDPPFDMEYFYSTHLLERGMAQGARVFNNPQALRNHSEKLSIAEFPQFTAPTMVTRRGGDLRAFVARHGQTIFKPLDGMGGMGIFRVDAGEPNLSVIIETLTRDGAETVMAQKYLPAIKDGDKRILLIDGKPVPYCLARVPKSGETRGNLAAGGTGIARELTARDREIAETLGPILAARGLFLVGLDVIGDNLTEINVTSPTCFQEITQQSGCNVAALFIDALEKAAAK